MPTRATDHVPTRDLKTAHQTGFRRERPPVRQLSDTTLSDRKATQSVNAQSVQMTTESELLDRWKKVE